MENNNKNNEKNNNQKKEENNEQIRLKISYEQNPITYKCFINELLEIYIKKYEEDIKLDLSSIYVIYNGDVFYGEQLKKPIKDIINEQNRKDREMTLLIEKSKFDYIEEDEIIIILSILSVKRVEVNGKRGEKIKNIIKDSIEFDFKFCIFTYGDNEIDIEQKFDDIAKDKDKKQLKIVINLKYTIPLIVNLVDKQNNKYKTQCLLGDKIFDKIELCFDQNNLNKYYYYLVYENKIFEEFEHYSEIFYEIFSEDKIKNRFNNDTINNNVKSLPLSDSLVKVNQTINNDKEKIIFLPMNKENERKIEIEFKIIKQCWCIRLKVKILDCHDSCCRCWCEKEFINCFHLINKIIYFLFGLVMLFLTIFGWGIFK